MHFAQFYLINKRCVLGQGATTNGIQIILHATDKKTVAPLSFQEGIKKATSNSFSNAVMSAQSAASSANGALSAAMNTNIE